MAADFKGPERDWSGQFQSSGHLFAGNSFNIGSGHGDPGKGQTMVAMALVEEITQQLRTPIAEKGRLTFFFCQGAIAKLNNALCPQESDLYVS